ncbi:endonuclease/exonuclease/phosphatase family protein [Halotalea alkalilenta]|uniref:Endonuclease n=1 Tax=Halotalea alkalilenta TaxID=376489 RepID=A0A172YJT6_9GAMM|nr:endonuclease/exonuclease/phosphatase family protein [Halotalea alkalilenta]ANF59479.1 endonuclease [Halotalea alkalilenta]
MTFNLQVGISTRAYYQYLTNGWQHFLPNAKRSKRLELIGELLRGYDLVALQEVDGGSFRSGNINQIDYLAGRADMPYRFQQLNRNLGRLAQHSNGLLCRLPAARVENHRLPGPPGRGAIHARFGIGDDALHVFVAHLALGAKTQARQLDYLSELISPLRHVVLMGDLNCTVEQMRKHPRFFESLDLQPLEALLSYPAWQPKRALDHILISSTLTVRQYSVLDQLFSDHLPVAAEIELPEACAVALDEASDIWIPPPKTVLV